MTTCAVIAGVGAVCPLGNGIRQVEASVRAGLGAQARSSIYNRRFEAIRLALVPEPVLEPLDAGNASLGLTSALRRMLRLAGPALREAAAPSPPGAVARLFVGLPEPLPRGLVPAPDLFRAALLAQAKLSLSIDDALSFPVGRAAALLALESAVLALERRQIEWALVGGIDTHLDLRRLAALDAEFRLLGGPVMDGFIPGEGAAFLLLTTAEIADRHRLDAAVGIAGTGTAVHSGHRYASEPARGEGLSSALEALASAQPLREPINQVFAGLNGENFGAKEWGVARIRYSSCFAPSASMEHPADCYGDPGAAAGALLLGLAERSIRRRGRGPVLVWASSDGEARACAALSARHRT